MEPVIIGNAELWLGDCREILPMLPKVDCVLTDPPYFKVLDEYWDNEWDTAGAFLSWIGDVVGLLSGRMKSNASLYLFASPQMASRVEIAVRAHLNVLAMLTWNKGASRKGAAGSGVDVTSLRTFWQASSERIVFAEKRGSDEVADGEAGYTTACETAKRSVFGEYLAAEFGKAGATRKAISELFPSASGGLTGCVSNWVNGNNVPTKDQYERMRAFLNASGGEYLRKDYEELRKDYEELRRPFALSAQDQWTDVWTFDPPASYPGRHPCEKPLTLLRHALKISTKPGAVVLDAFMGSGAMGDAALGMGRKFIGIERDERHFQAACRRIEDAQRQGRLFA